MFDGNLPHPFGKTVIFQFETYRVFKLLELKETNQQVTAKSILSDMSSLPEEGVVF